ncbi:hypothetical protein MACJ_001529 [Theileria orientalis]|uniref:PH domain-containing protein n=1 Tax=Theileria orientalis TaxID=68886 RepID=A0A976M8N6_THEOR|nr:hypothetical protein MACJ_001529 [Theileria orientalis]
MKIVEFRIPIPLKLSDYQRCSIHLLIEASLREMEGGSGLEIFRNEKFKSNDKIGYYTEKRYHLAKWNLYPKLFTKYNNEVFPTAEFSLQSDHIESLVVSDNLLNLNQHDLKKRQIMFVDLTKFSKLKNYDSKYDITKVQIGDFLPIKHEWYKDTKSEGMISYKLLRLNIPYFGMLSSKIENYIVNFLYESIIYYTCMGLCSYENWKDLTIENLRATEVECYDKLNDAFNKNYSKTLDKSLKLKPVTIIKGTEIMIPKELSSTQTVDSVVMPEKDSFEGKVDESSQAKAQAPVANDQTLDRAKQSVVSDPIVSNQVVVSPPVYTQPLDSQTVAAAHQVVHSQGDKQPAGQQYNQLPVNELVYGQSVATQNNIIVTDRETESVRSYMTNETFRIIPTESILPDLAYMDDIMVNVPKNDASINQLELSGPVPVLSEFDDSEFKDAVENLEDLPDSEDEKALLSQVPQAPESVMLSQLSVNQPTQAHPSQLLGHVQLPGPQMTKAVLPVGYNTPQVGVGPSQPGPVQMKASPLRPSQLNQMNQMNELNQLNITNLNLREKVFVQPTTAADATANVIGGATAHPNAINIGPNTNAATPITTPTATTVAATTSAAEATSAITSDTPTAPADASVSVGLQPTHEPTSVASSSSSSSLSSPSSKEPQKKQKDKKHRKSTATEEGDKNSKGVEEKVEKKDNLSYDIPITFTGYLYKLGKGFLTWNWNLRYIIVCGFNLYYFDKKNDVKPKDTINLKNSRISWAGPHMSRPFVFSITTESKEVYFWSADEEESVKRWILLLQVLCEESPPNIVKQLAYELTYHQNNSDTRTIISKF